MAIIEFRGGPVTHRSLMNKSKSDLAHDYMALLRCWEGMKKRAEQAEAQLTAARAEGERWLVTIEAHATVLEQDAGDTRIEYGTVSDIANALRQNVRAIRAALTGASEKRDD